MDLNHAGIGNVWKLKETLHIKPDTIYNVLNL